MFKSEQSILGATRFLILTKPFPLSVPIPHSVLAMLASHSGISTAIAARIKTLFLREGVLRIFRWNRF